MPATHNRSADSPAVAARRGFLVYSPRLIFTGASHAIADEP